MQIKSHSEEGSGVVVHLSIRGNFLRQRYKTKEAEMNSRWINKNNKPFKKELTIKSSHLSLFLTEQKLKFNFFFPLLLKVYILI